MSGRGGGGGGWRGGRGGGRGGRGGGSMGNGLGPSISFQDLQDVNALDKTPMKLYPEMHNLPSLGRMADRELRFAQHQLNYMREQRHSPYWIVQKEKKSKTLARYSDKYRPAEQELPSLKTVNMNRDFFPSDVWDSYMNGVVRRERATAARLQLARNADGTSRLSALDRLTAAAAGAGGGGDAGGDDDDDDARRARAEAEKQDAEDDEQARQMMGEYEDEEDDDYVFSYFDNGEGGDEDGLGDGGGGDDGGDYD
ncbi:unnamed protein product [Tilletia controversa]|uniref:DNA-directed RNA polymerase III subunit n=3 Tax=Tilletia TaxID=13289 RepID=A0A8X7MP91_9BASI|nr:hypothetical protein CF335_g7425 [Tilletia laevis]KAE8191223.1 hypothetical protein CF328_g5747 [Tilletia controversa]KAE8256782.1 hypothetical protein A4X03_0g5062 [Tilletia caries]KAE8188716.1 hypothetical protein CF336_g6035 [Tilletia laevis]KAE8242921.1 hypothetical protein A4X06_0g6676 [Tilletia controversa]